MVKKISRALRELILTLKTIQLFNSILDTLIVFSVAMLIITLIGALQWYYGLIIAIPFFIVHTWMNLKKVSLKAVEEKVPSLKDALRTSADYVHRENEVVNQLHQEVLKKMRQVKSSYFLGIGTSFKRLVLLTGICYAIILIAVFNVHLADMRETTDMIINFKPLREYAERFDNLITGDEEEIYGEPTEIILGTKELNLQITPLLSELDITELKPLEEQEFKDETFPDDVYATAESAFEEDIAEEHKEIVKNYFAGIIE